MVDNAGNNVRILLGDGLGGFAGTKTFAVGSNPFKIAAGDFNADQKADLVAANSDSNDVSVLLGDGLGGFAAAKTFVVGKTATSVIIGDFNGDQKTDRDNPRGLEKPTPTSDVPRLPGHPGRPDSRPTHAARSARSARRKNAAHS